MISIDVDCRYQSLVNIRSGLLPYPYKPRSSMASGSSPDIINLTPLRSILCYLLSVKNKGSFPSCFLSRPFLASVMMSVCHRFPDNSRPRLPSGITYWQHIVCFILWYTGQNSHPGKQNITFLSKTLLNLVDQIILYGVDPSTSHGVIFIFTSAPPPHWETWV